jgi:hypothetical protein
MRPEKSGWPETHIHEKIVYRGGIAHFHVPTSWVEEYEPAGGGTFYENKPGTGTLRVNVMDLKKEIWRQSFN